MVCVVCSCSYATMKCYMKVFVTLLAIEGVMNAKWFRSLHEKGKGSMKYFVHFRTVTIQQLQQKNAYK